MSLRAIPRERICDSLDREAGLSAEQVTRQRKLFGSNEILVLGSPTWRVLLKDTARDPMIWFLLSVGLLFAFLGERIEALTLFVALVPIVAMDMYLHRRTQASTAGLASRLASYATVLREGMPRHVRAGEVVASDIVVVQAGELFPADGVLLSCAEAQVDESSLTGEAFPARKQAIPDGGHFPSRVDPAQWGFAGTRLLVGQARMLVLFTGQETTYGEIVHTAVIGGHGTTPLQKAVGRTVTVLLAAAVVLCVVLAITRLFQGHGLLDALLSALVLAVAALPEEFPIVLTFFLGVGVYRLARKQVLVRRAVVVENIGRISCICSDKTGTLTEGKLTLTHTIPLPVGTDTELGEWASLACREESDDPLDIAILQAFSGLTPSCETIAIFPFTEDRRREVSICTWDDGRRWAVMKGAPEEVFGRCDLAADTLESLEANVGALAEGGHKVIAIAAQQLAHGASPSFEPQGNFLLKGILALEDPLREGVREAVATCRGAGIKVVMITGDHPLTAMAVAKEAGICAGPAAVLAGDAIDRMLDEGSGEDRSRVHVFARATPSQKYRLVQALQAEGHVVAVTGDGVNDVPALKAADIGIAMGARGTQSAREVASIILLDDNFRTIVRAVAEGRQLFHNLRLAFAYLVIVHIPFVLTAALIPLMGYPLFYLPVHIVWLELIIHPTALLVFQDLPEAYRLDHVSRRRATTIFSKRAWFFLFLIGVLLTAAVATAFELGVSLGGTVEHARTLGISILIFSSAAATAALSSLKSAAAKVIVAIEISSLVLVTQVPQFADVVHLAPQRGQGWAIVVGVGICVFTIVLWLRRYVSQDT